MNQIIDLQPVYQNGRIIYQERLGVLPVVAIASAAPTLIKTFKNIIGGNGPEYPAKIYVNSAGQKVVQQTRRATGTTVELPYEGPVVDLNTKNHPATFARWLGILMTRAIDKGDYADINNFTIDQVLAADDGQLSITSEAQLRSLLDPAVLPFLLGWNDYIQRFTTPAQPQEPQPLQQAITSLVPAGGKIGWILAGAGVLLTGGILYFALKK